MCFPKFIQKQWRGRAVRFQQSYVAATFSVWHCHCEGHYTTLKFNFCAKEGKPLDIHRELCYMYGVDIMGYTAVTSCFRQITRKYKIRTALKTQYTLSQSLTKTKQNNEEQSYKKRTHNAAQYIALLVHAMVNTQQKLNDPQKFG